MPGIDSDRKEQIRFGQFLYRVAFDWGINIHNPGEKPCGVCGKGDRETSTMSLAEVYEIYNLDTNKPISLSSPLALQIKKALSGRKYFTVPTCIPAEEDERHCDPIEDWDQ